MKVRTRSRPAALAASRFPRSWAACGLAVFALCVGVCPTVGHAVETPVNDGAALGALQHAHLSHAPEGCQIFACCGAALRAATKGEGIAAAMSACDALSCDSPTPAKVAVDAARPEILPAPPPGFAPPLIR